MKKIILASFVSLVALTSCNKETKLENRLEGKWEIDHFTTDVSTVVSIQYPEGSGINDTTYLDDSDNENIVVEVVGDIDFVSDTKLVMNLITTTTTTTTDYDGDVDVDVDIKEESHVNEYYVSGKDEITIIDSDNNVTIYNVTNNKRDTQTWEYEAVETYVSEFLGVKTSTETTIQVSMGLNIVK